MWISFFSKELRKESNKLKRELLESKHKKEEEEEEEEEEEQVESNKGELAVLLSLFS